MTDETHEVTPERDFDKSSIRQANVISVLSNVDNVLMPLAAINFAFDRARNYFNSAFRRDLEEKTSYIPLEHVIEPKAAIAGPAIQGLAFTNEEPSLKDMFLSLIATSMDGRVADAAHPAFVEVIKQIASDEATFLKQVLNATGLMAIAELRVTVPQEAGFKVARRHVLNRIWLETGIPYETPRLEAMIDNWMRLGLVNVDYATHLTNPTAYDWVTGRPEYKAIGVPEGSRIEVGKGTMAKTSFGSQFAKAVGLV